MRRKASTIPQSTLCHLGRGRQAKRVSHQGGAATAAPSVCAPAFLTTRIESVRPSESKVAMQYGINLDKSYIRMMLCCRRFLKFVGVEFDFTPTNGDTKAQMLGELIEYFENKLEPMGLSLHVSKKTPKGEEQNVLECAVYRFGSELEDVIVIIYACPAIYLSNGMSALYKRFIKFVSDSTNIQLGISEHGENYYLELLSECVDQYDFDEPEIPDPDSSFEKYKVDGEFWNLFDEIGSLSQEKETSLLEDLTKYRDKCPEEELDLLDSMIEGVPIIKDMNYYWFEFNPEDDGLPDEYGRIDNDGWSSGVFASAILFSENDGVSEQLLDSINNDVNSGIMMSGWNIHQWLSPTISKKDIDEFMRCKDILKPFDAWLNKFCREASKFDLYGKSEQYTE